MCGRFSLTNLPSRQPIARHQSCLSFSSSSCQAYDRFRGPHWALPMAIMSWKADVACNAFRTQFGHYHAGHEPADPLLSRHVRMVGPRASDFCGRLIQSHSWARAPLGHSWRVPRIDNLRSTIGLSQVWVAHCVVRQALFTFASATNMPTMRHGPPPVVAISAIGSLADQPQGPICRESRRGPSTLALGRN